MESYVIAAYDNHSDGWRVEVHEWTEGNTTSEVIEPKSREEFYVRAFARAYAEVLDLTLVEPSAFP